MLQNLHTHVNLCDGKNTPEQMIEKAISMGFDSIGFSSHAKTVFGTNWEMSCSPTEYIEKINKLKAHYSDKIEIFVGTELDYYSKGIMPTDKLDYTIGSVHMTQKNGELISFDHSYEIAKAGVETVFDGDSSEYVRAYYEKVVEMSNEMHYDIVGHFDLLTKFSESYPSFIDTESKTYRSVALEALREVRKKRDLFEVNTGAIARGYRTTPYPAPFILKEMKLLNCKLVLTSDCHDADFLDLHFEQTKDYVESYGFDTLYYLTKNGFKGEKIR